jgi:NADH dehydrogenase
MKQAARWARGKELPFLFMPYFGLGPLGLSGSGKLQPVHVDDVAAAFASSIDRRESFGRTYNLAGPDVMDWPTMHGHISRAVRGKKKTAVGVPAWYASMLTRVVPAAWLPFNQAQVQMARENNVGDITEARADLDFEPRRFAESVADYAAEL